MTTELYHDERAEETKQVSTITPKRKLVERAYARATGAPLIEGNGVRLLRDAEENYPAWLEAIGAAERTIHFESFILHEDDVGREFAKALCKKAREGVRVRLVYDWLGAVGKTSRRFWRNLRDAGIEVRGFNPPRFDEPFGWLNRDHRKMISVDGRIGFVMGLCVGQDWKGRPEKRVEPWRDTGVEVRGPAVADMDQAFARIWKVVRRDDPAGKTWPERDSIPPAATLLCASSRPSRTRSASTGSNNSSRRARERLYGSRTLTSSARPYYVQALRAAARTALMCDY